MRELDARKGELARHEKLRNELTAARERVDSGQFGDAVELLNRLHLEFPSELQVETLLSHAQQELAAFEKRQAIDEAIRRCEQLGRENQFDQALATLDESIRKYPDEDVLARAHESIAAKQRAALLNQIERDVRLHLENEEFDRAAAGRPDIRTPLCRGRGLSIMLLDGWSREEVYYIADRGYRLYREGRLHEAAILFTGLVVIDPEDGYCRQALAAISSGLGQHGSAVRHLSAILERHPHNAGMLGRRCEALLAAGDFEAARRDFDLLASLPDSGQHGRRLQARFPAQVEFARYKQKASQLLTGSPR